MDEVKKKQAFRSKIILKLLDTQNLTVDELILSVKKIEDYVFTEHLTYCVENMADREMLDGIAKEFIEQRKRAFKNASRLA